MGTYLQLTTMIRRVGIAALSFLGAAQAQNKCWSCTESTPITDLTNSNGACYFTSSLDSTDASQFIDCDGHCYVKYTSEDGILTSVQRGCLAASGDTTATGFDFFLGETGLTVANLTGTSQLCDVDTTAGGVVAHQVGSTFTENQDANRLTDLSCAKICEANSDTVACNGGAGFEVETLSDCGGTCKDTTVCTCDHWTGQKTFTCAAASSAVLGFTERPVLVDGAYECQAYDCGNDCSSVDSSTDPATLTPIAGAGCYGDGTENSQGTCQCNSVGTATTNTNLPYTGGLFVDATDPAAKTCTAVTCNSCTGSGQQCQHALFASSGTCNCQTLGDVFNSNSNACETPAVDNPKCQQCSSDLETGSACADGTVTATQCASAGAKCAAVSTLWVNAAGESIREVVERGCSDDTEVKDTCEFQTISTSPVAAQSSEFDVGTVTEVTCRYVCDGDNCNNQLADGIDDPEPSKRSCNEGVVCTGVDSCKAVSDFTADVTSAYSTAECDNIDGVEAKCVGFMDYLEHLRYDGKYERSLVRLEFKCQKADDDETKDLVENVQSCSSRVISLGARANFANEAKVDKASAARENIYMHKCMTVCDTDNCNNAWPGQPTCYTCDSATDVDGTGALKSIADSDYCFVNVDMAEACPQYYQNACFVRQSGLDLRSNWAAKSMNQYSAMQSMGAYKSIARGCAQASEAMEIEGSIMTRDDTQNQHAYVGREVTCLENGCNFGPALPTPEN